LFSVFVQLGSEPAPYADFGGSDILLCVQFVIYRCVQSPLPDYSKWHQ